MAGPEHVSAPSSEDGSSLGVDLHEEVSDQDAGSVISEDFDVTKQSPRSDFGQQALKDGSKRKRASKTAKLRQSKLDVRREQWLAQVTAAKVKGPVNEGKEAASPSGKHLNTSGKATENDVLLNPKLDEKEPKGCGVGGSSLCHCQGMVDKAASCSATAQKVKGKEIMESGECSKRPELEGQVARKKALSRSMSQPAARSVQGSGVGGVEKEQGVVLDKDTKNKPAEEDAERSKSDKGAGNSDIVSVVAKRPGRSKKNRLLGQEEELDDWEAAADAICPEESSSLSGLQVVIPAGGVFSGDLDSKEKSPGPAWRLDDSSRPQTLPRLAKFNSMPMHSSGSVWEATIRHSVWGTPPAPSFCPICTEELDGTDSSFCPCPCGFRLCLFCHHRIAVDDGRCPGCRKAYSADVHAKVERYIQVPLQRSHMIRLRV